ncbi:7454_t:CDS:2, partial [Acaulospora morrowiae]
VKDYIAPTGIYRTEREHRASPLSDVQNLTDVSTPTNIDDEIRQIKNKFLEVNFEKVGPNECTFTLHGPERGSAFIRVNISFPEGYPRNKAKFKVPETGMTSVMTRSHIKQDLDKLATKYSSQGKPCLEACIGLLLGQRQDFQDRYGMDDSDEENLLHAYKKSSKNALYMMIGEKEDHLVPFPILCGARFSMNGKLVCFFSSLKSRGNNKSSDWSFTHPQAYDTWEQYKKLMLTLPKPAPYDNEDDPDDFHALYFTAKAGVQDSTSLFEPTKSKEGGVYIVESSEVMPVNYELATKYTLNGDDAVEICEYNARVAAKHN